MIVKVYGDFATPAVAASIDLCKRLGHAIYDPSYYYCDLAIAPLLTRKLTPGELSEPVYGVLLFHPSPLPYGRGASAIRHAYRRHEPITAASWIWATGELDAGDICEQEILKIDYLLSPRDYYAAHVIPALLRTLERCLNDVSRGFMHRVPQRPEYSSYDLRL